MGVVAQSRCGDLENLMVACCAVMVLMFRVRCVHGKSAPPDAPWSEVSDSELVELISPCRQHALWQHGVQDYVE